MRFPRLVLLVCLIACAILPCSMRSVAQTSSSVSGLSLNLAQINEPKKPNVGADEPDELQQIFNFILTGDQYYSNSDPNYTIKILDRAKCTVERTMRSIPTSVMRVTFRQVIFFGNVYRNRIRVVDRNTLSLEGKDTVVENELLGFEKWCQQNRAEYNAQLRCNIVLMELPLAKPGLYRRTSIGIGNTNVDFDADRTMAAINLLVSKYCEMPTSQF